MLENMNRKPYRNKTRMYPAMRYPPSAFRKNTKGMVGTGFDLRISEAICVLLKDINLPLTWEKHLLSLVNILEGVVIY